MSNEVESPAAWEGVIVTGQRLRQETRLMACYFSSEDFFRDVLHLRGIELAPAPPDKDEWYLRWPIGSDKTWPKYLQAFVERIRE